LETEGTAGVGTFSPQYNGTISKPYFIGFGPDGQRERLNVGQKPDFANRWNWIRLPKLPKPSSYHAY
jgi:hypothetical protein